MSYVHGAGGEAERADTVPSRGAEDTAGLSPRLWPRESRPCSGEEWPERRHSHTSTASLSASQPDAASQLSDGLDTLADVVDEPPQLTALERKLVMKKHPMLRNDTNAHILAPPDFRIGMK